METEKLGVCLKLTYSETVALMGLADMYGRIQHVDDRELTLGEFNDRVSFNSRGRGAMDTFVETLYSDLSDYVVK